MPCNVDIPAIDYTSVRHEELRKLKEMKKRGELAEEALCALAREVIATQPSILVNLLVKDDKFHKTWVKHQEYDRKEGRSFYTFDAVTHTLFFWPNTKTETEVKVISSESVEKLTDVKPTVTVGQVNAASLASPSLLEVLEKAVKLILEGEDEEAKKRVMVKGNTLESLSEGN